MSIIINDVSFTYMKKTPYEKRARSHVTFEIKEGEIQGIIGHTGSGKSTLIQHINALLKLQEGTIQIGENILLTPKRKPKVNLVELRQNVGMVFQYPEYQLFDETVYKDVAFGPKNLKIDVNEIDSRVKAAIELTGLDFNDIKDRSPFELSGGQKRRVAIAGVLAMRPKVLILDEPTAGLDPSGRTEMYEIIRRVQKECTPTIIIISHNMDEIAGFADRICVIDKGEVKYNLPPKELYTHKDELLSMGLDLPVCTRLTNFLKDKGVNLELDKITVDDFVKKFVEYKLNKLHGGSNEE